MNINQQVAEAIGWNGEHEWQTEDLDSTLRAYTCRRCKQSHVKVGESRETVCEPPFSTDLNAAWSAAEKLFTVMGTRGTVEVRQEAGFPPLYSAVIATLNGDYGASGETPSLAICNAIVEASRK